MNYLVTGSNRGLGLELVREGAGLGHTVIATCRNESKELIALAEEFPGLVHIMHMDAASTSSVEKAASKIKEQFNTLNGYINNAAVLYGSRYDIRDPLITIDLDETEDTLNINVLGIIRVMKFFTPLVYAASGSRCIMNISSASALISDTGYDYASYSASKSAVNNYTQRMRNYLASQPDKSDISVYMIHPGCMDTLMGKEYAQIHPSVSAKGIWSIIDGGTEVRSSMPFYEYNGKLMKME